MNQSGPASGGKGIRPQHTATGSGALQYQGVPRVIGQFRRLGNHPGQGEEAAVPIESQKNTQKQGQQSDGQKEARYPRERGGMGLIQRVT